MKKIKSYSEYNQIDEGIKSWVSTVMMALSLLGSTPNFA